MWVYVLKSGTGKLYIGHTEDLERRVKEHRDGRNIATKAEQVWQLIHSEAYDSRPAAVRRENFLKTGDGRRVLKNKGVIQ